MMMKQKGKKRKDLCAEELTSVGTDYTDKVHNEFSCLIRFEQ
jgi:hypothetical protein